MSAVIEEKQMELNEKVIESLIQQAKIVFPGVNFTHQFTPTHRYEILGSGVPDIEGKTFFRYDPDKMKIQVPLKAKHLKKHRILAHRISEQTAINLNLARNSGYLGSFFPGINLTQATAIGERNEKDPLIFLYDVLIAALDSLDRIPNFQYRIEGNGNQMSCSYMKSSFELGFRCTAEGLMCSFYFENTPFHDQEPTRSLVIPYSDLDQIDKRIVSVIKTSKLANIFKPVQIRDFFFIEAIKERMLRHYSFTIPSSRFVNLAESAVQIVRDHFQKTDVELEKIFFASKNIKNSNKIVMDNYVLTRITPGNETQNVKVLRFDTRSGETDFPAFETLVHDRFDFVYLYFYPRKV